MKKLVFIFICCLAFVAFGGNTLLLGKWTGNPGTMSLNENGTGTLGADEFRFNSTDKIIVTTASNGQTMTYDYILKDSVLTISGGDLDSAIVFKKIQP